jgi:hypothetical protein
LSGGSGGFLTTRPGLDCRPQVEGFLAGCVDLAGLTVGDLVRRHQADASMVMILIIPIKEAAAERLCVLDAAGDEPAAENIDGHRSQDVYRTGTLISSARLFVIEEAGESSDGVVDTHPESLAMALRLWSSMLATSCSPSRGSRKAGGNRSAHQTPLNVCMKSSSGESRPRPCWPRRKPTMLFCALAGFWSDHNVQSRRLAEPCRKAIRSDD